MCDNRDMIIGFMDFLKCYVNEKLLVRENVIMVFWKCIYSIRFFMIFYEVEMIFLKCIVYYRLMCF